MIGSEPQRPPDPDADCPFCPRLARFREANRIALPGYHNGPVPSFGTDDVPLLVVGLAPGLHGANRSGRPFTGDHAGGLLYATLLKFGFAHGTYGAAVNDGLQLAGCRVTNAVRCVPPENKPTTGEVAACRPFLRAELDSMAGLRAIVALGQVAHRAVLAAKTLVAARWPIAHGAVHRLPDGLLLADSYHCSRYNTNPGKLTTPMFEAVFAEIRRQLGA